MGLDLALLQQRLQQALGDEFSVGPLLGQGGFAAVFRAREADLNRDVAIKVLDLGVAPSPTLAERFVREAQTVAQLEHPNIVPIYNVGKAGDVLYIVMRCVDGPSLRQLLATHRRLSVGDAARVARQVADALAYAHASGVVHRDIKPDNILLDKAGRVLVTDFGIAKAAQAAAVDQLTGEGMIIGTPQYMSPEQAAGEAVDGRSDVYSLGIVLYQMLAGSPPFDGASSASILAKQLTAQPPPLERERSDVSAPLKALLDRMLAKDPAQRFQNAAAVSQALVDVLPAAAGGQVRVRRHVMATVVQSLVAVTVVAALLGAAFVAGAAVVLFVFLNHAPALSARAPLPDSVAAVLRQRGALAPGDTALYAFRPDGREDSTLLLVSAQAATVVTPHTLRRHVRACESLEMRLHSDDGLHVLFYLERNGSRDTIYAAIPPRSGFELVRRTSGLIGGGRKTSAVRVGAAKLQVTTDDCPAPAATSR